MLEQYIESLILYCKNENFKGWDPYDGLNSPLVRITPFYKIKLFRQCWIRFFKYSPYNLRPIFFVNKDFNTKGLAIFILGFLQLYEKTKNNDYLKKAKELLTVLEQKKSCEWAWGYNFPWQSRAFFADKNSFNAICSIFAAQAFFKAYECLNEQKYLDIGLQTVEFLLKHLNITYKDGSLCFSYTAGDYSQIHNINLLMAALLAKVFKYTKKENQLDLARKAVRFSLESQHSDGSWHYGAAANQRWIDSFHTAFNLLALKMFYDLIGDKDILSNLDTGIRFYGKNFFLNDGTPKYYADKIYPIDIHSAALGIITMRQFGDREKAKTIFQWAVNNLWDKKGYFYFQRNRTHTIKIPYMRWAQGWMLYAMSYLRE